MRTAQVGDIVVLMEPCMEGCGTCDPFLARTALVVKADPTFSGFMSLRFFDNPGLRGGYLMSQLFNTGLKA